MTRDEAETARTCAVLHASASMRRFVGAFPAVRGGWMLASLFLRLFPPAARCVSVSLSYRAGAVRVELDLSDGVQFAMGRSAQFDVGTASVLLTLLRPGDVFVDVGSNWGCFTALASQAVGSGGLVLALEPNRDAHRRLHETIHRNGLTNVLTASYAAYADVGRRVSLRRPFYRQTTSSYVREATSQSEGDTVTNTVDQLWRAIGGRSVRVLKVDTEGAELPVLRGARELLGDLRPWVIVEVSAYSGRFEYTIGELYRFMASLGYPRAHLVSDSAADPGIVGPASGTRDGQILFQPDAQEITLPYCAHRTSATTG